VAEASRFGIVPPLIELGGSGPPPVLHLACANGFPPEIYAPLVAPFLPRHRVVSLPPRALWPGIGSPPAEAGSWWELAEDLLSGLETHGLGPVIGLGHSFGAVATMLAATREPSWFRALVMLDPTMLPSEQMAEIEATHARGEEPRSGLAERALKRRARFDTADEAFRYWRSRPLFVDWSDDALRRYVAAMLLPADDGEGYRTRWTPAWEAWYYRSFYPGSWRDLDRLDPSLPVLVVRGAQSDTFSPESETEFWRRRPGATFAVLPDHGHLFPLAAPETTAEMLQQWLGALTQSRPT
jgi:pimeloyl-ACP methyl ester carboxylesterase